MCESLLGLNDYLATSIPNLSQLTCSNLIETKKNKSNEMAGGTSPGRMRPSNHLGPDSKDEQELIKTQRTKKLYEGKQRRDALKKRTQEELVKLGQIHFITSAAELQGALADIEKSGLSVAKKRDKKLSLLKDQIKIREKSISRT